MDDIDITLTEGNTRGLVISNEEFMRMMGISVRTARRWRGEGKIAFVEMNRKIYYAMKEVERFIERNQVRRKRKV
jgi:predicted site-specific integrase-resolvase